MPRLIDAEAFAEKVYRAWDLWEKKENDCFVFSDIITPMLISMPTVDAVPLEDYQSMERTVNKLRMALADAETVRHGHWIHDYDLGCTTCSECGDHYLWEDFNGPGDWNYCPNCGAKMDEVEDG